MPKRVSIVGNGHVEAGSGAEIDAAEVVIRFNEPSQPSEDIGSKTSILFLANAGKSMQAWLETGRFLNTKMFLHADEIILPYHPSVIARYHPQPNILSRVKGRRADWTWKSVVVLGRHGKQVTILSADMYDECCDELHITPGLRRELFPSTGFMGIYYALKRFPPHEWRIELRGFSWTGWKRHSWERERGWVLRHIQEGTLFLG